MRKMELAFRLMQIFPIATLTSITAQIFGVQPQHGLAILSVAVVACITILRVMKGHSLSFALQTVTGLAAYRQIAVLKGHIPDPVRTQIENGNFDFENRRMMDGAVVGLVDIVGSAQIANRLGLTRDFELKKRFLRAAAKRAARHDILILNHTGDGFLLLANHFQTDWKRNLVSFSIELATDFETLIQSIQAASGVQLETGLRFGVACGSVMLGCLGSSPAHFTAVGTEVNLAARLCSVAAPNEIVFSESAWKQLHETFSSMPSYAQYHQMKGFDQKQLGVHVKPVSF